MACVTITSGIRHLLADPRFRNALIEVARFRAMNDWGREHMARKLVDDLAYQRTADGRPKYSESDVTVASRIVYDEHLALIR